MISRLYKEKIRACTNEMYPQWLAQEAKLRTDEIIITHCTGEFVYVDIIRSKFRWPSHFTSLNLMYLIKLNGNVKLIPVT